MKRLISFIPLLFAMVSMVFSACSDDNDPNPLEDSKGTLNISVSSLAFGAEGGEASFTVQGGTAFVRSEAEWLEVARVSGNNKSSEFSVVCVENTDSAREGTILVNLNGAFERIAVVQAGKVNRPEELYTFRTAKQIAADMYPGWNLGNTLEAPDGETGWQDTQTTQEIIDFVKAQGFKAVRIPCSWYVHATEGRIDAAWLARVKQIVDYCIKDGLYVVLNDHWDGGWIEVEGFSQSTESYKAVDEETITSKIAMLKTLWTQIANAFQNYDEHLLFAGLNEPFQQYNLFNGRHAELAPILMRYNQAFVDAVRATEGNNANRTLVVQAPATSIASAVENYFSMPTDATANRLMVEVHYYEPWDFCGQEDNGVWFWGAANHVGDSNHNATWGEEDWAKSQFERMNKKFYAVGVPVIVGEYGAQWRELSANQKEHDASVKAWFKSVTTEAINNGAIPFAWDINARSRNGEKGTMTILNRKDLSIFCQPALDGIKEGVTVAKWK